MNRSEPIGLLAGKADLIPITISLPVFLLAAPLQRDELLQHRAFVGRHLAIRRTIQSQSLPWSHDLLLAAFNRWQKMIARTTHQSTTQKQFDTQMCETMISYHEWRAAYREGARVGTPRSCGTPSLERRRTPSTCKHSPRVPSLRSCPERDMLSKMRTYLVRAKTDQCRWSERWKTRDAVGMVRKEGMRHRKIDRYSDGKGKKGKEVGEAESGPSRRRSRNC